MRRRLLFLVFLVVVAIAVVVAVDVEHAPKAGGAAAALDFSSSGKKKAGSTNVIANKNFMSVMENSEGKALSPDAVRAIKKMEKADDERRLEAEKANGEKNVEREVREAQEQAFKTNERGRRAAEKRAEREVHSRVTLSKNWQSWGGSYGTPEVHIREPFCFVTGLVKSQTNFLHTYIGKLPKGCRPGGRLLFSVMNGAKQGSARLDVKQDGSLFLVAGKHQVVSLTGIYFTVADGNDPLELSDGWKPYGGTFQYPEIRRHEELVMLSGLVRNGLWDRFASIPNEAAPKQSLPFSVSNHQAITRIDVDPEGDVKFTGGAKHHGWASFDGIFFALKAGNDLALKNDWTNVDVKKYRRASVYRHKDLCMLSGVIKSKSNTFHTHIATLPANCRPRRGARLVFLANSNSVPVRIDINKDGKVIYVEQHGRGDNWISLQGISFIAQK